jgi:hypothetical protein
MGIVSIIGDYPDGFFWIKRIFLMLEDEVLLRVIGQ